MTRRRRNGERPDLRDSARGQDCTFRWPGVCNGDPATTVLAHARTGGMAMKCPDTVAFFACGACHAFYDRAGGPWREVSRDEQEANALRAVGETHGIWQTAGLI